MKDYIQKRDEKAERRYISPQIEVRSEADGQTIEGIAAVVNSDTDLGWYTERIAPGAFDNVLKDDVAALFNHDPNFPLARTTAKDEGKLELFITKEGHLGYRYKSPNTSIGKDLAENIRTGIVQKSSFAFTIEEEEWKQHNDRNVPDVRTIKKIKRLYDVSPVTYPAYNDTSVAARSLEMFHKPGEEYITDQLDRDKDLRELM